MYKPPIELLVSDIQTKIIKQQDEEIYKAVLHYVPNVNKDELLRALRYDRLQYEKGYADGKAAAMNDLVRCKDCKHYMAEEKERCEAMRSTPYGLCIKHRPVPLAEYYEYRNQDDFCSYGERRSENG